MIDFPSISDLELLRESVDLGSKLLTGGDGFLEVHHSGRGAVYFSSGAALPKPEEVSGFEGQTVQKQGIPTKIPTKCRDLQQQLASKRESRNGSRHHVAIAGKPLLGLLSYFKADSVTVRHRLENPAKSRVCLFKPIL